MIGAAFDSYPKIKLGIDRVKIEKYIENKNNDESEVIEQKDVRFLNIEKYN